MTDADVNLSLCSNSKVSKLDIKSLRETQYFANWLYF